MGTYSQSSAVARSCRGCFRFHVCQHHLPFEIAPVAVAKLTPVIDGVEVNPVIIEELADTYAQLRDHTLDIVLSNLPAPHVAETGWPSTLLHR